MVTTVGLGYEAQLVDQVLQWRVAGNTAWNTVDTPVTAAKYRFDGGGTYVRLQYIGDWSYNGGAGPTGGVFTAPATAISPTFTATRGGSDTDWTNQLTAADLPAETTATRNAAIVFLDHVDFTRVEARNMVTHRLAVAPVSPTIGQAYYDTGLSKRGTWNGYQWDYGLSDDRPIGTLNAGVSLRGYEPITTVTATKTLAIADSGTVQNCTNTAAAVITIPLNTNVAFPICAKVVIQKTTAQTVTLSWAAGVTVLSELGTTLVLTNISSFVMLRKTATDTWICQQPIVNNVNLPGNATTSTQVFSDSSTLIATTAHVKNVLLNSPSITGTTLLGASTVSAAATLSVPTVGLGNVSLQASNTTQVARSCRPIVIVSRTTAFTFTTTYTDLIFNNIIRDNSSAYNTTTGVFTAPYAGIYSFSCLVSNFANTSTYTLVGIGSAANTETMRLGLTSTATTSYQVVSARQLIFLNASDTRRFGVQVGSTNAVALVEASTTARVACYMSIEYLGIDT